jgi:hypothetical protein
VHSDGERVRAALAEMGQEAWRPEGAVATATAEAPPAEEAPPEAPRERRRPPVALLVVALVAVPPAHAKEGVKATLKTPIPFDAKPGTKLDVSWTLWLVDQGRRRPFGAGDVFVRLVSATGEGAETAYVDGSGTYTATVAVPKGGIGDVRIGLRGFSDASPKPANADMLFPITNDPMPGPARIAAHSSERRASNGTSRSVIWIPLGAAALSAVGVAFYRRRRSS